MELQFPPARRRREFRFFAALVIASEAKQSRATRDFLDCFVALRAPRNDEANPASSYRLCVRTWWARLPTNAPFAANGFGYMFLESHSWQPFGPHRLVAAKPHSGSAICAAIAGGTGC
jgi:hypothetical protein